MSCKLVFVKFENVLGGAVGYYDLVDSQNRVLFENLASSELEAGMTFSIDSSEEQFRLTNFRLNGDANPCQTAGIITDGLQVWLQSDNESSFMGGGADWFDLSGNFRDGTILNYTVESSPVTYLDFSPANAHGYIFYDWTEDLTISMWLKRPASVGTYSRIISTTDNRLDIAFGNSDYVISYFDSDPDTWTSTAIDITTNDWFNLVVTIDSGTIKFYKNGSLESTNSISNEYYGGSGNFVYWATQPDAAGAGGARMSLNQLLVYNRALSGSEVTDNFNVDKAKFGL